MALNMREGPKWKPGVVVEQLGPLTYLVDHLRDGSGVPPDLLDPDLNEDISDDTYYPSQPTSG